MPLITNLSDSSVKKNSNTKDDREHHVPIEPEVPHSGRGITDPHTAKQKSTIAPGITPPDYPLHAGEWRKQEDRERDGREDRHDVTDRKKGSEVEYLKFSSHIFYSKLQKLLQCWLQLARVRRF